MSLSKNYTWNKYPNDNIRECEDIDDFIFRLTTLSKMIDAGDNYRYIYRGVADINHKLIPSALREKNVDSASYNKLWSTYESIEGSIDDTSKNNEVVQRRAELYIIQKFYQYSEYAGLPLPLITNHNMREELLHGHGLELQMAIFGTNFNSNISVQWPPKELYPIMSLAQHYGLPTRLLDWSRNPFIAAYFAASGAIQRLNNGDNPKSLLCIYASIADIFETYAGYDTSTNPEIKIYPARLIQPPSAENPNLLAQQGVFSVIINNEKIPNQEANIQTDRRELSDILLESDSKNNLKSILPESKLFTLYLPISEAPKLLLRLRQLGFSANKIYDGYVGAVKATEEDALIKKFNTENIRNKSLFRGKWKKYKRG